MTKTAQNGNRLALIPLAEIRDPQLKKIAMFINNNMATLQNRLETAQKAVLELQRRQ